MITRIIETTTLKVASVEIVDGQPKAVTETITYYGKKRESEVKKLVGNGVIISSETTEKIYEMSMETFVNNATIREEN